MSTSHIPDVLLERYRLQELPPVEAASVAARLREDAELHARLSALDASDAALRGEVERLAVRLAHLPARRRSVVRMAVAVPVVVTAAALTAVVIARLPARSHVPSGSDDDRVKGTRSIAPTLAVYRRTSNGSERLGDGTIAHPGDVIRVGYGAGGHRFGAIVSVDGRGNVTRHLPTSGDHAAPLKSGAIVLLDQAYELDDAPDWERFEFVVGDAPFDLAPVLQSARAGTAPPPEMERSTFTIRKEANR